MYKDKSLLEILEDDTISFKAVFKPLFENRDIPVVSGDTRSTIRKDVYVGSTYFVTFEDGSNITGLCTPKEEHEISKLHNYILSNDPKDYNHKNNKANISQEGELNQQNIDNNNRNNDNLREYNKYLKPYWFNDKNMSYDNLVFECITRNKTQMHEVLLNKLLQKGKVTMQQDDIVKVIYETDGINRTIEALFKGNELIAATLDNQQSSEDLLCNWLAYYLD